MRVSRAVSAISAASSALRKIRTMKGATKIPRLTTQAVKNEIKVNVARTNSRVSSLDFLFSK